MTRLADVLVVQAVRAWLDSAPGGAAGLAGGAARRARRAGAHRDPPRAGEGLGRRLARARGRAVPLGVLGALHGARRRVRHAVRHRLAAAARAHAPADVSSEPLSAVAHRFGYQSEAAFSRAFKRTFGVPPGLGASARRAWTGGPCAARRPEPPSPTSGWSAECTARRDRGSGARSSVRTHALALNPRSRRQPSGQRSPRRVGVRWRLGFGRRP